MFRAIVKNSKVWQSRAVTQRAAPTSEAAYGRSLQPVVNRWVNVAFAVGFAGLGVFGLVSGSGPMWLVLAAFRSVFAVVSWWVPRW